MADVCRQLQLAGPGEGGGGGGACERVTRRRTREDVRNGRTGGWTGGGMDSDRCTEIWPDDVERQRTHSGKCTGGSEYVGALSVFL